jgi:hypothetical protein
MLNHFHGGSIPFDGGSPLPVHREIDPRRDRRRTGTVGPSELDPLIACRWLKPDPDVSSREKPDPGRLGGLPDCPLQSALHPCSVSLEVCLTQES